MSQESERARRIVYKAIRSGTLIKPDHCQHCGLMTPHDRPHALQAHHEDYERPLAVEWLCYSCHGLRDFIKQVTERLGWRIVPQLEQCRKSWLRQLRWAKLELKKREWLHGIPERHRTVSD